MWPMRFLLPIRGHAPSILMIIRPFCESDIESIMRIVHASTTDQYTSDFFLGLWTVAPRGFLVAEINRAVVGFIVSVLTDIGMLRILMVCVTPERRKQGIASGLIDTVITTHKPSVVYLEVRVGNANAIQLYQKHGFVITGILSDFYPDGSDAYKMERKVA